MAERRQRMRKEEDAARMHERAALFFALLEHRERAEAERTLARRARLAVTDSPEERDEDRPLRRDH